MKFKTHFKKLAEFFEWLILPKKSFPEIPENEYYKRFGVSTNPINGKRKVKNKQLLINAYTKAWENRDFEINKFWTRAAYFWGFIVLIFGGYITILTGENPEKAIAIHLDLFLLLLGFLFSVSWLLVIYGSKTWQRNWEAHIDALENFVSGPIYKTVFYSGNRFYSVSKLNEVMAIAVIAVWGGLLGQFLFDNFSLTLSTNIDWPVTIAIFLTLVFAIILVFGYSSGSYKSKKDQFFDRWNSVATN